MNGAPQESWSMVKRDEGKMSKLVKEAEEENERRQRAMREGKLKDPIIRQHLGTLRRAVSVVLIIVDTVDSCLGQV